MADLQRPYLTADQIAVLEGIASNYVDPLTTKGDTLARSATATTRLAVGANGTISTADSTAATGIKWAAPTITTTTNAAPADGTLVAGGMVIWLDPTNGAGKLMIKAKTADGTVVTGSVTLT